MFDECLNLANWRFTCDSTNFNPSYYTIIHLIYNFNKINVLENGTLQSKCVANK